MSRRTTSENSADSRRSSDRKEPRAARAGESPLEKRTLYDSFRENLESLIIAVILAVIIRHFAVEAFEIPTGSMAPTLYGVHLWETCPNCGTEFNVAVSTDSRTGEISSDVPFVQVREIRDGKPVIARKIQFRARCPLCHHEYLARVSDEAIRNGNKIFVDKFIYVYGEPHRFDVIVFEFDQTKNYIKRLVGLPGETIHIVDGDLYVDGKIVRKAELDRVQEELWYKVSDSSIVEKGLNSTPAWAEVASEHNAAWTPAQERTRWSLNHPGGKRAPAVLEYRRPLDNFLAYNLSSHDKDQVRRSELKPVGDRRIDLTVKPLDGDGWIGARIRDGRVEVAFTIPVGKPSTERPTTIEVTESGLGAATPVVESVPFALEPGRATELRLENVDDQAILTVDGKRVASLDFVSCPDPSSPPSRSRPERDYAVELLGWGVRAELRDIRLYRDVYYDPDAIKSREWKGNRIELADNEYLALGDNSASSSDGRDWGPVPEQNLMGKALMVFWPAWPLNFQMKFIR